MQTKVMNQKAVGSNLASSFWLYWRRR